MKCDIGHFEIHAGGRCYNLIPSFKNMMELGRPDELVQLFDSVHEIFNPNKHHFKREYLYAVADAAAVIRACCDVDPSPILVDVSRRDSGLKMIIGAGDRMTAEQQLIVAAGLLRHGISGVRPSSAPKRKASKDKATEIDLWEFVHAAMVHLEMPKSEVMEMTMTEFSRIWDKKFPPEKNGADDITDEEYDEAMARLARINKLRDKK